MNFGSTNLATTEDFAKLDIRVGRVIDVKPFPEGRHSTHVFMIDFGPSLGSKKSLAKLAPNYAGMEVVGRQIIAVVSFPPGRPGPGQPRRYDGCSADGSPSGSR